MLLYVKFEMVPKCPTNNFVTCQHIWRFDSPKAQKPKIYFLFVFIFFLVLISFISLSSVPRTQSLWWNFISFTYITNSQISVTKSEKQRRRRRRRKWNLNVVADLLRQRSSSNRSVFNSSSSSLFYWYNSNRFSLWICYEQFCCCCSWSPLKVVWFCLWILSRTHCDLHLD